MSKFSLMDYMNEASKELANPNDITEQVSIFDIEPNENNFYGMRGIEKLKESIILLGGVQENLILVKNPPGSSYKYKALAGHRRRLACMELVQEGNKEFEYVPAVIKENISEKAEKGILLLTNSTQRGELTDYEKVMEHIESRKMIEEYKKEQKLEGRIRKLEAEYLQVSEGQIAIYDKIINNLSLKLMKHFEQNKMGISAAYEAARRDEEEQRQIQEYLDAHDTITETDIKAICGSRIKGQRTISDMPELKQPKEEWQEPELEEKEKPVTKLNVDDENMELAVCMIFDECHDKTFPEGKLEELFECFRQGKDAHTGYINQQLIFNKMLPFENDVVKVTYECGYRVDFIHTDETITIPIYYFWKAFDRHFKWNDENVTESVTQDEKETPEPESEENVEEVECKLPDVAAVVEDEEQEPRNTILESEEPKNVTESVTRVYELADVQEYIRMYEADYELASSNGMEKTLKRTSIFLDALRLLENTMI